MTIFGAPWPIILLVVMAVLYPLIARALSDYAHPKRMRIEQLGRSLVADSKLTAKQRQFVQLSLEMNGTIWPMLLIAVILPFLLVALVLFPNFRTENMEDKEIHALLGDKRYAEIRSEEIGCLFAANPIAGIVVAFEVAFVVLTGAAFLIGSKGIERTAVRTASTLNRILSTLFHGKDSRHTAA